MLLWNNVRQSRQYPLDSEGLLWLRFENQQDIGFIMVVDARGKRVAREIAGLQVTDGDVPVLETSYVYDSCIVFLQTEGESPQRTYKVYVQGNLVMELKPRVVTQMALHGSLSIHADPS